MTTVFGAKLGEGGGYVNFQYFIDFKRLINETNCVFCGILGVFITLVSPSGDMGKLRAVLIVRFWRVIPRKSRLDYFVRPGGKQFVLRTNPIPYLKSEMCGTRRDWISLIRRARRRCPNGR